MKIFGIGLSKTGTSSLAHALEILGYRTKDNPGIEKYAPGDVSSVDGKLIEIYDALTDTPIPSFYRELDKQYPGSKFILTVRELDSWLKSCKKQFNQKLADKQNDAHNQLFLDLYDSTVFDEQKFTSGYHEFVNGVLKYFENRPQDLLVLDVISGDGWEKLCPFLGKPIQDVPFPKANVTNIRWMNIQNITDIAQKAGREMFDIYRFMHPDAEISSNSRMGALKRLRYQLPRLLNRLSNKQTAPSVISSKHAQKIIELKLRELNPEIPIVSPETSEDVPYEERHKWNHFWLVDPLSYIKDANGKESDFTISISLIEDRVPILGVVYLPDKDTTYFSMKGKGSFRVDNNREPVPLQELRDVNGNYSEVPNKEAINNRNSADKNIANPTLELCLLASGEQSGQYTSQKSMEWQTAAVHAILIASSMQVSQCQTNEPLSYNKIDFNNGCISIDEITTV